MVVNSGQVLPLYPQWVQDAYNAAQNTIANTLSGQDLTDAVQRQDDVVWTYWNNVHKAPKASQWHEDWFNSDLSKAIAAEKGPAKLKGLNILKQALADSKSASMKSAILGQTPQASNASAADTSDTDDDMPTNVSSKGKGVSGKSGPSPEPSPSPDPAAGKSAGKSKKSTLSKIPVWAYGVGGVLILGAIAFFVLKPSSSPVVTTK